MEMDKGLMASLRQVKDDLDDLKKKMVDESDDDEIADIQDTIEFYKSKRTQIKKQLRS